MTQLLQNKKGLIFGLANQRSIAWGIAQACHAHGAKLGFTYLNDALAKRVVPLAESVNSELIVQCDVQNDRDIENTFKTVEERWGELDFVIHSVAYANGEDLKERFYKTSREGFKLALDVSAYSLVAVTKGAVPLMKKGGSVLTLSYLGSTLVVPHYRLMGVAKAALEASVRELAVDLGPDNIRVNCISAGPIKTLAASGIADFRELLGAFEARAPLRRLTSIDDVGASAAFMVSDLAAAITGEITYVDCGFNITAL